MPRAGLTREKVIEAAARLANENGLGYVTISTLAAHLKIKKPSLYNHIESQDDILRSIMVYGWTHGIEPIAARIQAQDAHVALKEYARFFYKYALENPGIFEAMLWYNKYQSEELVQATEKLYEFFFAQTDKLKISRENANHLLRTYRAFLEGFALLVIHKSFGNPISIEESFELSLDVLVKGMAQFEEK